MGFAGVECKFFEKGIRRDKKACSYLTLVK